MATALATSNVGTEMENQTSNRSSIAPSQLANNIIPCNLY